MQALSPFLRVIPRFLSTYAFYLCSPFSRHPSYLAFVSFSRLDVSLVTRPDNNTLPFSLFWNSLLGWGFVYSSSVLIKSFWRPLVSTVSASKIQTTTTATNRDATQPPSSSSPCYTTCNRFYQTSSSLLPSSFFLLPSFVIILIFPFESSRERRRSIWILRFS